MSGCISATSSQGLEGECRLTGCAKEHSGSARVAGTESGQGGMNGGGDEVLERVYGDCTSGICRRVHFCLGNLPSCEDGGLDNLARDVFCLEF